jgi:probable DNA metabolism protein
VSTATRLRVCVDPDFAGWREYARAALSQQIAPDAIDFSDATVPSSAGLFEQGEEEAKQLLSPSVVQGVPHVPREFLQRAVIAAYHRDPLRWNLLYRLLWRLQTNRTLLRVAVDGDVNELLRMEQQVRRDEHKMHAFVRFRRIEESGEEHFVAWYEPQHRILELAAPFFAERFAIMRWSILTPDGSVSWDPAEKHLRYGPAVSREHAPTGDELEELWKSYYSSIFNPARLNPGVMRSHMPVRYWNNLPEVALLPTLMNDAAKRVEGMVITQNSKPSAAPFVPVSHTLKAIRDALPGCKGCDLYCHATQVVPGRGSEHASLLLVGEQPGDQEDIQGKPFVGPAGRLLREAMEAVGVHEEDFYMTNAVKHFKFVQRGKLRLHQNPRMSEISACKPWLLAELDALKPKVVLCLGASAAKSLLGGTFALMRDRGKVLSTPYAERVMATIHPSAVLRARDEATREMLHRHLREDLMAAYKAAQAAA